MVNENLPICNLKLKVEKYRKEIIKAQQRVVDSGWFIMGPEVSCFERSFAEYIGVKHCCTVANGTDAIELALRAAGVSTGTLVATVANAGMYTTTALLAVGARPLFLDVDLQSKVVLVSEIKRAIEEKVKAIVVTHLYGQGIHDIREISSLCREADVILIEDCAQAHGAKIGNNYAGSFGDLACFSFYPTKNLGALGDGGAVVSNNQDLAERISKLRQYGWSSKYKVTYDGGKNSRLDELQASILNEFLPFLEGWNVRRRNVAKKYVEKICNSSIVLPEVSGDDYVAHLFVVRADDRDSLRTHLSNYGISSEVHYPIPDYRQPLFNGQYAEISLKNTEMLVREIVTLPCYPEISEEEIKKIIRVVNLWKK